MIIVFIAAAFAVAAFMAGKILMGLSAAAVALFFAGLMVRNIMQVKKIRENKGEEK